jgi:hypothetical protein
MAVAAGGGGTTAADIGPDPLVFCFFIEKLFAESLKVLTTNHCRELELRLTAKCRQNFAVSSLQMPAHDKLFAVSRPLFAVRNRLTAKKPFLVVTVQEVAELGPKKNYYLMPFYCSTEISSYLNKTTGKFCSPVIALPLCIFV